MKKIRILLADDHSLLRRGLASILECEADMEIVGEAANGATAVELAAEVRPDVIIMDISMPVMDGVEATRRILDQAGPDRTVPRVLILTSFGTSVDVNRAMEAGVSGAIVKDTEDDRLAGIVRKVMAGERVISPEIAAMLRNEPPPPELSPRQLEILDSIARGFSNQDIAGQLGISPSSIKTHVDAILMKLGAATRAEAVAIALRRRLMKA